MGRILRIFGFIIVCTVCAAPQVLCADDTILVDFKPVPTNIISMIRDSTGMIWFNSGTGLYQFDGKKIKWVNNSFKKGILVYWNNTITTREILEKRGINTPNPLKDNLNTWGKYLPGYYSSSVVAAATDKNGIIWITSGRNLFGYEINSDFELLLAGHSTRGILQDASDLYINTYSGIFKNQYKILDSLSQGNTIKNSETELLITAGSLMRYDKVSNRTKAIPFSNTAKTKAVFEQITSPHEGLNFTSVCKDRSSVWAGTTKGLFQLRNDSLYYTGFPFLTEHIQPTTKGLLLATAEGIFRWEKQKAIRDSRFPKMYFNAVYIIGDTCWATSENGIWVSTGPREKAKKLFKGSPLSNLETYCIEKDLNGFIWVSSVSGLYRFKPGRTYYDSYLPSEEFNKRSSSRIRDSLYFGTIHGVIRLNPLDFPDKLPENTGTRFSKWVFVLLFSLIILIVLNFILWTKWKNATRLLEDQKTAIQLKENNLLEDLQEYIIQNITTVTVESMSKHVNMNPRTLYRIMEINYGMKPGDLIRTIKQNRIKELQKNTPDIDIVSLANQSGYSVSHIKRLIEQGFQEDED